MYIETVPNRNSPPAILLREGWREGQKTRKRTLANLSAWPQPQIDTLRRVLRGETLVSPKDLLNTAHTSPHGHVEAILAMIRRLDLDTLISSKRCRERDLVVAMIVQRLISPSSKLATTSFRNSSARGGMLSVRLTINCTVALCSILISGRTALATPKESGLFAPLIIPVPSGALLGS